MEDIEIKNTWKVYDRMIEESKILNLQSWALNVSCFETLQTQKAKANLKSLILPKVVMIILGAGWILFLAFVLYYSLSQIIIAVSLAMMILSTIVAMVIYINDIAVIANINYSENILKTQKKIAFLQASVINAVRILWLQLPFYTTFYISNKLAATGGIKFWIIQIPVTLFFTWLALFLFKNISLKNAGKKWVKGLINGYGLSRIFKAMEFINEIDNFKKE